MLRVKNDVTQSVYTLIIIKKTNKTLSINISWEQTSKVKYIVCFIFVNLSGGLNLNGG